MLLSISFYIAFILVFIYVFVINEARKIKREIIRYDHLNLKSEKVIGEKDLEGYPELLREYLIHSGVVGQKVINQVYISSRGKMRLNAHGKWGSFTCVDYNFINIETFIEEINMRFWMIFNIKTLNKFKNGNLEKLVLIMSSFASERINGKYEENHNGIVRYFRRLVFSPTCLMDDNIAWSQVGENVLVGVYDLKGYKLKAYFALNDEYQITNFVTRKFYKDKNRYKECLWSSQFSDYEKIDGYWIPTHCQMQWHFDEETRIENKYRILEVRYQ